MQNVDPKKEKKIQESVRTLLYSVQHDGNNENQSSPSVYMTPAIVRDLSPSSFNPRVVSIGPLHKKDKNVQTFERQKVSYLSSLMSRIDSPKEEVLESCMREAYNSMNKIMTYYVWPTPYRDVEIAEMMVMDACFILEFMVKLSECTRESYPGKLLLLPFILADMVLLENQIPLFFLHKIFRCTISKPRPEISLGELIRPILLTNNLFKQDLKTDNISIESTPHILGWLHKCYEPPEYYVSLKSTSLVPVQSAVNLHKVGVIFKPNQNPNWPMQMEVKIFRFPCFLWPWSKPCFKMPILYVHDSTELIFRNLIAYEQSRFNETHTYVTSYAFGMDMLINTQEDVAKLADSGVLSNVMGSNEEAANMINNICKYVGCLEFFYEEEYKTLNNYCNSYWPKNIAKMRNTYFSSPWSMIALIAGIMLFVLTVIQTIFTVKPVRS